MFSCVAGNEIKSEMSTQKTFILQTDNTGNRNFAIVNGLLTFVDPGFTGENISCNVFFRKAKMC